MKEQKDRELKQEIADQEAELQKIVDNDKDNTREKCKTCQKEIKVQIEEKD